jgi:DNA (cytosine-5)-methyltransferase 1
MENGNGNNHEVIRFIDLFCGIGGFRYAMEKAASRKGVEAQCVFSCDIDAECQKAYAANFGEVPHGNIRELAEEVVPDHEILLAGFPCQPFSIIGHRKGFEDTRGTLFFDIARILKAKRPVAFVLENVKLLVGHNGGRTLGRILETLRELGYKPDFHVFNALNFGLPQKRERVFIVGFRQECSFEWPEGGVTMTPLARLLERRVPKKFYASERIRNKRWSQLQPTAEPTIWHENKAGHISAYPYSCALRAGASYNYLLVNGERRLTPREMLRLQGFPDSFKTVCNDYQTRKQAGNSLPVPVAAAVIESVFDACGWGLQSATPKSKHMEVNRQLMICEAKARYKVRKNEKSKTTHRRKIRATISA